ncbi:MAG TPA: hypothetical protein VFS27_05890 [Blastocatellia bacterium]|nr:hypothetical protein [Blastocatellia bacterium]
MRTYEAPGDYERRRPQANPGESIPKAVPNERGEQTDQRHDG